MLIYKNEIGFIVKLFIFVLFLSVTSWFCRATSTSQLTKWWVKNNTFTNTQSHILPDVVSS